MKSCSLLAALPAAASAVPLLYALKISFSFVNLLQV
jgi:hypothetical protein